MRIIVTNINPNPIRLGPLAPSSSWWVICSACVAHGHDSNSDEWTIEAENEQHAVDYAMQHARMAHPDRDIELRVEQQLVIHFAATKEVIA